MVCPVVSQSCVAAPVTLVFPSLFTHHTARHLLRSLATTSSPMQMSFLPAQLGCARCARAVTLHPASWHVDRGSRRQIPLVRGVWASGVAPRRLAGTRRIWVDRTGRGESGSRRCHRQVLWPGRDRLAGGTCTLGRGGLSRCGVTAEDPGRVLSQTEYQL